MTRIGNQSNVGPTGSSGNHGPKRTAPKAWHGRKITVESSSRLLKEPLQIPSLKSASQLNVSAKQLKGNGGLQFRFPRSH